MQSWHNYARVAKLVDDVQEHKCREGWDARERPQRVARRATQTIWEVYQPQQYSPLARVAKLVDDAQDVLVSRRAGARE